MNNNNLIEEEKKILNNNLDSIIELELIREREDIEKRKKLEEEKKILEFEKEIEKSKCEDSTCSILLVIFLLCISFIFIGIFIKNYKNKEDYIKTNCIYANNYINSTYKCCSITNCQCISVITSISCEISKNNLINTTICNNGKHICNCYNSGEEKDCDYIENQLCSVNCNICNDINVQYQYEINNIIYTKNNISITSCTDNCIEYANSIYKKNTTYNCWYNINNYDDIITNYDKISSDADIYIILLCFGIILIIMSFIILYCIFDNS